MTNSEYLRVSTRDEHSDIEATVDLLSLVEHPDLYVPLLKAFASYYRTIELKLSPFERELETLGLNLKERFKLPLLTKDLAHFSESLEQLPHAKIKAFEDIYEVLGAMYVLEGSTLGGQIIFNKLNELNMIGDNGEGGLFFNSYGQERVKKWTELKAVLNRVNQSHREKLLGSARYTFVSLKDWLASDRK